MEHSAAIEGVVEWGRGWEGHRPHKHFEILGGKWCILLYSGPFDYPAPCSMASQILAYTIAFLLLDIACPAV